jgi:hypothetical protein
MVMVVLVVLIGGFVGFAGSSEAAKPIGVKERPYKGEWSGTFEIVLDGDWCPPGLGPVTISIERGQATHLGRFSAETRHCTDLATGQFTAGVIVITAANGDELHGTYSGRFLPELPDGTTPVASTHYYDGGTGRFANATGMADAPAWFVFTSETGGVIRGTLSGTLSYDASASRN